MTNTAPASTHRPGWDLEDQGPHAYERYLVPAIFAPWAARLIDLAALQPGERVLDVGCGTGIVARLAAPRVGAGGRVAGLDPNEGMLAVARTAAQDIQPAITWQAGDAANLPFRDEAFDVVFCQQVLQFVPEPAAALQEIRRVLQPEGRLALAIWRSIDHNQGYSLIADALARHAGPEVGAIMRRPFPSWEAGALRGLTERAGFRDVHLRIGIGTVRFPSAAELLHRESASSPFAGTIAALDAPIRDRLVDDLAASLQPHTDDDGIVFAMETYLVLAQAAAAKPRHAGGRSRA